MGKHCSLSGWTIHLPSRAVPSAISFPRASAICPGEGRAARGLHHWGPPPAPWEAQGRSLALTGQSLWPRGRGRNSDMHTEREWAGP